MSDEVIVCADCRSEFIFTDSEASFFASKGLSKPRRCKACRQKRRDAKATEGGGSSTLGPSAVKHTQWVGGGEEVSQNRRSKRGRRRDRNSGEHGF